MDKCEIFLEREREKERVVKMRFYVDDQELISLSSDTHP